MTKDEVLFQSTPPVKAATVYRIGPILIQRISIHAAREGGDEGLCYTELPDFISIHAAREGGDVSGEMLGIGNAEFQSTPPVKAATNQPATPKTHTVISIHAAREGGDGGNCWCCQSCWIFQSTPPVKAATVGSASAITGASYFNPRRP